MEQEIRINKEVGWRPNGNEIIAFNCKNQQIVIWNETASRLWELLAKNATLNNLINWLITEYSLPYRIAKNDAENFLHEASSMGFIDFGQQNISLDIDPSTGENALLQIELQSIENLIPFSITFETTYSCNERCIHCFMDREFPSLETSAIKRILSEIADEECVFITFTGGEFFTRKDALEIIEYASNLHFVVDILSNGTLIDRQIAKFLSERPIGRIQFSLYGATSKTHDFVTKLDGSFNKTIKAIELLKSFGIKVEIAFPLMGINFHERYATRDLVKSFDCLISPNHMITARNNGATDTFDLRLSDEQLKEFLNDKELFNLYAGRKPFKGHQFYLGLQDIMTAPPCYSGFNSCAITPSGKVLPCNQFLYELGDLQKNSFSEIWHNSPSLKFIRNLALRDLKPCSNCELLYSCSRCPGLALLEGGSLLGSSPENCRVAKISGQI